MDNLIAVSSWSLHRTIGATYHDSPSKGPQGEAKHSDTQLALLNLPAALRANSYEAMQLCHFHLPSREPSYTNEFRAAAGQADVELLTVLIDEGDVTDPEWGEASVEWIAGWVRTAAALGASRARVIAGKQPYSPEAMDAAVSRLTRIADAADEVGLALETENWFPLLATPAAVNEMLDRMDGRLALCADFGNWPRPQIYEDLPKIMPRAETCHAKLEFLNATDLDEPHTDACLRIAREANYKGPYVIVNGGKGDSEWEAIEIQRKALGGWR